LISCFSARLDLLGTLVASRSFPGVFRT
jgi:hypothetical protein